MSQDYSEQEWPEVASWKWALSQVQQDMLFYKVQGQQVVFQVVLFGLILKNHFILHH